MHFPPKQILQSGLVTLLLAALIGCADGPFYQLWYRKEWLADEKYGPTFHTKLGDLAELRAGADVLTPQEQTRYAVEINRVLPDDPSPVYRAELVKTLAAFSVPAAREGLRVAVSDEEPSVRIAACKAWGEVGDREALETLGKMIGSDSNRDVRMAAARELADFADPAAVQALGLALNDPDPALQHRAVQSLESVTGKDFGGSVPAWREYVQGGNPTINQDGPTIAERLRRLF